MIYDPIPNEVTAILNCKCLNRISKVIKQTLAEEKEKNLQL
jgi:hypothetical protein